MPRSANAVEQRLRRRGRRRDRHAAAASPARSRSSPRSPRSMSRSCTSSAVSLGAGGHLNGVERDADDDPAAREVGEHVAQRRRRRPRCRTRGRPRPGRASPTGSRSAPSATTSTSASNVPASVSTRFAAGSMAVIVGLHEPHAGLHDVGVAVSTASAVVRPNITSSFEKPNTNPSDSVDQHDIDVVAELLRQPPLSSSPPNPAPSTTTLIASPSPGSSPRSVMCCTRCGSGGRSTSALIASSVACIPCWFAPRPRQPNATQ